MISKKITFAIIIVVSILLLIVYVYSRGNGQMHRMSLKSRFQDTVLRSDVEPLSVRLPWLDIVSCQWKAVHMNNEDSGVPGPSDTVACGYIEIAEKDFDMLSIDYEWFDVDMTPLIMPVGFEDEQLNFTQSQRYQDKYRELQKNSHIALYVDFGNKFVYFSGSFSVI